MINIFSAYARALQREAPSTPLPMGVESAPNFFIDMAKWTAFFSFCMILAPRLAAYLFPRWYKSLDEKKKNEFPPYIVSMLHHCLVVPYGWWYLVKDFMLEDYSKGLVDYTTFLQILPPFICGFVIADTLFYAIPESLFHAHHEFLVHHVLALLLFVPFLYGPGALVRFYPHLVVCETTNLLFNIAWLLHITGHRDHILVTYCEVAFAIMFFFLRFINLTFVFLRIFFSAEGAAMGLCAYILPPISAMQWYWMYLIGQKLVQKLTGSAHAEGKTKADKKKKC